MTIADRVPLARETLQEYETSRSHDVEAALVALRSFANAACPTAPFQEQIVQLLCSLMHFSDDNIRDGDMDLDVTFAVSREIECLTVNLYALAAREKMDFREVFRKAGSSYWDDVRKEEDERDSL